jgi:hypothetical protein
LVEHLVVGPKLRVEQKDDGEWNLVEKRDVGGGKGDLGDICGRL